MYKPPDNEKPIQKCSKCPKEIKMSQICEDINDIIKESVEGVLEITEVATDGDVESLEKIVFTLYRCLDKITDITVD